MGSVPLTEDVQYIVVVKTFNNTCVVTDVTDPIRIDLVFGSVTMSTIICIYSAILMNN